MYLSLDRNLVDGDKVVRSSYFSACCDGGRGCHSAVLRGDHHCDVVWWSKLGGAARDVVDVVRGRCGRSSAEPLETWSVVDVVGAWWSRSGCGRRSPWLMWSVVDEARTWSKRMAMKSAVELLSN